MKKTAQRAVRNPLRTRVFKEIIGEWKKYAVIFVFLTAMIGFVSGMYVANNSMLIATERIKTEQIREDGHFELDSKATAKLRKGIASSKKYDVRPGFIFEAYEDVSLEDLRGISDPDEYIRRMNEKLDKAAEKAEEDYENAVGEFELDDPFFHRTPVRLFENFCKNADEDIDGNGTRDSGIRVYKNRDDIDLYSVMDGRPAEKDSEIMIDRMHADNRGIKVGDKININGEEFEVCGLAAFSNYSTLHEKSTDMMFDALTFDVAMTTEEGWDRIKAETKYEYAWLYREKPADVIAEKKLADNFMKALITQAAFNDNEVKDFVPEYTNPAINFAPDDFGSDKAMGGVILDILIVVLAFIFAITVSNTISREA
ncbi:MAG: hypothetical protein E7220_06385, partial [Clostridiales bacterium]|nr:hypothetical protein [Clostridiales bacterium]